MLGDGAADGAGIECHCADGILASSCAGGALWLVRIAC